MERGDLVVSCFGDLPMSAVPIMHGAFANGDARGFLLEKSIAILLETREWTALVLAPHGPGWVRRFHLEKVE